MKIEKIGDNHWKISKIKKIKNAKNKDVEIYDEPFEIGRKGIEQNIANCQAMIDFYNNPSAIADAKTQKLQEKSDWEDILNNLE